MATAPVFIDTSGRRWRRIRRAALALGVLTTIIGLVLVVSILIPDAIPELHPQLGVVASRPLTTRTQRLRRQIRRKWREMVAAHGRPPAARRASKTPALPIGGIGKPDERDNPIIAGFYVNWDENSYASLDTNLKYMDWVVLEWGFIESHRAGVAGATTTGGGDSLIISPDGKIVQRMAKESADRRPRLLLMISNFDTTSKAFRGPYLHALLDRPAARAKAIAQIKRTVADYRLAGVVVDFEEGPGLEGASLRFATDVKAALGPGHIVAEAVPTSISDEELRAVGRGVDAVFAMIFDEHWGGSDPGPVASQDFYARQARRFASIVPPQKLILMLGAYGYDWNDLPPEHGVKVAEEKTFQDVVTALRDSGGVFHFDSVSMNPWMTYTSPDSTDHVIWFLDGTTAYNEMKVGEELGVAGAAVWRLGSEDPALWNALDDRGHLRAASTLRDVPPGYYPEIENEGEVLRVRARPTNGARTVATDPRTGLVTAEAFTRWPTPYIVQRFGVQMQHPHWVALTFDDGPDGRWTGPILDTLKSRHAPATFFVIGENADAHIRLLRREYAEGHEIGNHSYSHPNLGMTSDLITRLQLDATSRLIEALVGRGTVLFRPPFFGDAEPTTSDELVPVALASERGLLTVGLHVDAEDWREPSVDSILRNVLNARPEPDDPGGATCRDSLGHRDSRACNVVLLHDGGGDRSRTVAVLGPLIDSLRARGDTLVLVSQLVGLTRDQAMPPLARVGRTQRFLEATGFVVYGTAEWVLFWVFTVAVVLGIGRLFFIGFLALVQRIKQHQTRGRPTRYHPAVSVIVPAFNEEKVICRTIESLLAQDYEGAIEVVVVDDGSRDATYAVARRAFGEHPQVAVYTKPNGGKASALNYGIARAKHEVVICLDADTLFAADTVDELVQPLSDPKVGAVAGNAKVGNRINIVTRWQALEYVTSQNLDRRAFSLLDCITVVPGAVGAWRREAIEQAGGFKEDTLAEDQDLTLAVRRNGYTVGYADGAVAYTEAPDTLRGLAKQRFRWSFGTLQCAWKHKDALFRPRYGSLGWFALPNVWLFQLLLPAISPIADLMFVWSLISVGLNSRVHEVDGRVSYVLVNLEQVLAYYAIFLLVDWLASMIAFLMEPGEEKQLTWLVLIQRFAYRQVMYWVVVRSFAAAFRGRLVGWGKLERKATVESATGARS